MDGDPYPDAAILIYARMIAAGKIMCRDDAVCRLLVRVWPTVEIAKAEAMSEKVEDLQEMLQALDDSIPANFMEDGPVIGRAIEYIAALKNRAAPRSKGAG